MSNKYYKNYNNISSTKPAEEVTPEVTPVEAEVKVEEVKEEVKVEEPTPVVEEVKPEPAPVVEQPKPQPKPFTGNVTGCAKLNVRKEPNKEAEVVSVINEGSEVVINRIKSTVEFYAVCTAAGIEGYCMKKFITVNK